VAIEDWCDYSVHFGGKMLAISITLECNIVSVTKGKDQAGLNCSADTEIDWEIDYVRAISVRNSGGCIH
jgi:hypothetical protein